MDIGYVTFANLLFILIGFISQETSGDGEILVHLHYYTNPTSKLFNGYCCDGWPFCTSQCDLAFSVCLDLPNLYHSTKECKFGSYRSEMVKENSDWVRFKDNFGGVRNPLSFIVPGSVNGKVTLKMDVRDVDGSTSDDFVDYLTGDFWAYKGPKLEFKFPFDIVSRSRLYTVITVRCAKGWHGETCRIFCAPPGIKDHYTCDPETGKKICTPPWGGPNCSKKLGLKIRTRTKWLDKIKRRSEKAYNATAKIKFNKR